MVEDTKLIADWSVDAVLGAAASSCTVDPASLTPADVNEKSEYYGSVQNCPSATEALRAIAEAESSEVLSSEEPASSSEAPPSPLIMDTSLWRF